MKHKIKIKAIATMIICWLITDVGNAQWNNYNTTVNPGNTFNQVDENNSVESVGIGDFNAAGFEPQSAFHINTNIFFNYQPLYPLGEVFRTNCPEDLSTYWRMWRVNGGVDTEMGNIYSLSRNDDYQNTQTGVGIHYYIQASLTTDDGLGDIRFNTGTGGTNQFNNFSQPRLRILGTNGFVGIGDYDVFLPNYQLHQHVQDDGGTFHQFTIPGTGITAADGFRMGLDPNANGEFNLMNNTNDMHFLTNTTPRMNILGGNGFVGIGDYGIFNPVQQVHQHLAGNSDVLHQFTNGNTGLNGNDGFRVGIRFRANPVPNSYIPGTNFSSPELRNYQNSPIYIYTNNGERMSINMRTINGVQRSGVTISERAASPVTFPRSILHLGGNYFVGGIAGWRTWLDVGTFSELQSDFAFFGIIPLNGDTVDGQADHNDAAIVWGDNLNPANDGADNFRIIFSAPMNGAAGRASFYNSLEVARFTPIGRVGFGNFTPVATGGGSAIQPLRRVEIYGENLDPLLNAAAPQLRLTFTPNANVNLGVWTDFQATSLGDLFINTMSGGTYRNVGINTSVPGNTLEINAIGISGAPPVITPGASGVRFNDLTNASPAALTNPGQKVLGLNATGDVILVNDIGGGSLSSICPPSNFLTKQDALGTVVTCSDVFNDNALHIGMFKSIDLNYRLEVLGNSLFTLTGSPSGGLTNMITTTHPLMVYSNIADNTGLTILSPNTSGLSRDAFRMFSDNDAQMHFQTIDNGTGATSPRYNVTFENDESSVITSWLGYNSFRRSTIIKDDFSTNPVAVIPFGKLVVESQDSQDQSHRSAIVAMNTNTDPGNTLIGIWAEATGVRSVKENIGGYFRASNNSNINIGVDTKILAGQPASSKNYAIIASVASVSNYNYGVDVTVTDGTIVNRGVNSSITYAPANSINHAGFFNNQNSTGGTVNYGVYANGRNYGLNANSTFQAIYASGNAGGTSAWVPASDSLIKTNVLPVTNNLSLISQLQVKKYNYDTTGYPQLNLMGGLHYGFIAQQVASVMPELVVNLNYPGQIDSIGNYIYSPLALKGMNYTEVIPLLVGAVMELKETLDSVSAQLDSCCNNNLKPHEPSNMPNISEVELTNSQTIILEQNVPNPFETETNISYSIPDNITSAKIIFFNNNGTVLKELDIKHKGKGTIKVYAPELSTGIYSYSLIADDKVIDTKKMMKAAK